MTVTVGILCGMDNERDCLARVFSEPQFQVFSGNDCRNLPSLVPSSVKLMLDMGLCGGIGPNVHVPDAVIAGTLSHNPTAPVRNLKGVLQSKLIDAASKKNIALKQVAYFSSGLFNTSDTLKQRIAIYDAQPDRPEAMSDETRFADALTTQRHLPLQVCRVLSDSRFEDADLPPAARGQVLKANGSVDAAFLAESLGLDRSQIPALIKLASDCVKAMNVLEDLAWAIKPVFLTF